MKLFNDILKEKTPEGQISYSQGRVYLLVSVIAYYIVLGLITARSLKTLNVNIDLDSLKTIIDALQWFIMLMAGYVFGGKGLDVIKTLISSKTGNPTIVNSNQPIIPPSVVG